MNLKKFIQDDGAVSPVIGVILMVAITVILAAVIGTFVLGLGDQVQTTAPQASFSFDFTDESTDSDKLVIAHEGGDTISDTALSIKGDVAFDAEDDGTTSDAPSDTTWDNLFNPTDDEVSAGDSGAIWSDTDSDDLEGATIRIIWSGESGDSSATLSKWTGPSA